MDLLSRQLYWLEFSYQGFHVHLFFKISMKKSCIEVQLANVPVRRGCNGPKHVYCGHFDDRIEVLKIVKAFSLSVAFGNHPESVSINSAIRGRF